MPLSHITEYLLAHLDESGHARIFQSSQRIALAALAAGARQDISVSVPPNKHSIIVYRATLDIGIVPGVMNMTFVINGNPIYDDVIGLPVTLWPIDLFALILAGSPGKITLVNNDAIAHNFECVLSYLTILNVTDFNVIMKLLGQLSAGGLK